MIIDSGSPYYYAVIVVLAGGCKQLPKTWGVLEKEKLKGA